MSRCRRLLLYPIVVDKLTLTDYCPRSNYQGTTGRIDEDECRWGQGILLYSHSVWICGDAVGLKYPLVSVVNGRGMPRRL